MLQESSIKVITSNLHRSYISSFFSFMVEHMHIVDWPLVNFTRSSLSSSPFHHFTITCVTSIALHHRYDHDRRQVICTFFNLDPLYSFGSLHINNLYSHISSSKPMIISCATILYNRTSNNVSMHDASINTFLLHTLSKFSIKTSIDDSKNAFHCRLYWGLHQQCWSMFLLTLLIYLSSRLW